MIPFCKTHKACQFITVLDSTGIRFTDREDLLSRKLVEDRVKVCIKFHVAPDIKKGKAVNIKVACGGVWPLEYCTAYRHGRRRD